MSYLFVFRAYPDIDHMVPLAWSLLEEGEQVHAQISPGYRPEGDYRLDLLRRYDRFHMHEVAPAGDRAGGVWRNTLPYALWFLRRHRVSVVAVEWGYGLPDGYDRPRSVSGAIAVARSLARSLVKAARFDSQQTRVNFIVAARLLGISTVSLPHGLNVKLDAATTDEAAANGAARDWRDRNRFSAYVLNTEHHRRWHVDHRSGDPQVMQTWGSLRWSPEWFALNRRIAPRWEWPSAADGRLKVVFMVPKWSNRVDSGAIASLVKRLLSVPGLSLAVKGHPRPEDGSADPLRDDPDVGWSRIIDAGPVNSVSLISAADVVIDIGSSIGIEVVMQEKVLINPTYLHELTTLFDAVPGACVVTRDEDGVISYLSEHTSGRPYRADPEAVRELMSRAVFASRHEPFDVVRLYKDRIRALAAAASTPVARP